MKKSNSEILKKVKNVINEKRTKITNTVSEKPLELEGSLDKEIKSWIEENAEKIARKIIHEEVKKIFK